MMSQFFRFIGFSLGLLLDFCGSLFAASSIDWAFSSEVRSWRFQLHFLPEGDWPQLFFNMGHLGCESSQCFRNQRFFSSRELTSSIFVIASSSIMRNIATNSARDPVGNSPHFQSPSLIALRSSIYPLENKQTAVSGFDKNFDALVEDLCLFTRSTS